MKLKKIAALAAAIALAVGALAGCGGNDNQQASGSTQLPARKAIIPMGILRKTAF